jgi:glycosyltransferase involved in cell wall biosynthesis
MTNRTLRVAVDGRVIHDRYHGIGRHTFELVRRLADRPVDLVVIRDPTPAGRLDVDGLATHPSVRLVDFPAPVVSAAAQRHWPALLTSVRPHVLVVPYHLATPLWHPGVPTVAFVHDCIFEKDPRFCPGGRRFQVLYRAATRLSLSRATAIATVSRATRQDLRAAYHVALADSAVIPHGVGEQFRTLGTLKRHSSSPPYVLHVGAHRPHKNLGMLVRAFARVAREVPRARLVLVGDDDPRFPARLPELARALGIGDRVDVRRGIPEAALLELYRGASAFAFPSLVEGFGLPVLEAMAAGLPVVTSDAPAVVEAAGGASLVVPRGDPQAWAAALVRVLTDARVTADLVPRGRRVAAESTWDRAADRTLALLESVCGRDSASRSS